MLLTILWFLLALGILVTIHEFGHFYIARRCGVKVIRFSVGFGKPLYSWYDRTGTEFTLAAIPLGGYVKMLDEREGEVHPNELAHAFTQKTVWQRMAIVIAGPVANFILAISLYFVLALMGSTGIAPVIGELTKEGLAANAGLSVGDEITAVDGVATPTWQEVFKRLMRRIGDTGSISVNVQAKGASFTETRELPISQWLRDDDQPDLLAALGIDLFKPDGEAVINVVAANSPADTAGIQVGDRIIAVDQLDINSWQQLVAYIRTRPQQVIAIQLEREQRVLTVSLTPEAIAEGDKAIGRAGVSAPISWPEEMIRPISYSLPQAVIQGFKQTWQQTQFMGIFIKKLVFAEVSTKNLSGTFTIAQVAGNSAKRGFKSYIAFLAFLSVSLGVFNLLPIPVLDGGHLLYYVIEAVKGSPVPEKIQVVGYQLGLFFVLGVMVVAHVNDLVRIFA